MRSFFSGLIDMTPGAIAARAEHARCEIVRHAAVAEYRAANAAEPDQAQMRLDADHVGQRAYWAARAAVRSFILAGVAVFSLVGPALAQDSRPACAPRPDMTREIYMQRAEARAARTFARIDADGNGAISRDERAADRERRRAAWQARQDARAARAGNDGR